MEPERPLGNLQRQRRQHHAGMADGGEHLQRRGARHPRRRHRLSGMKDFMEQNRRTFNVLLYNTFSSKTKILNI